MVTASATLYLPSAVAQNPPLEILDEGSSQGRPAFKLNCVGGGIACTHSGTTGTITVNSGGGGTEDNDLETKTLGIADGEIPIGSSAGVATYVAGLAACAADEKIEYVPGSPDTFTCEAITITESDISDFGSYLTSVDISDDTNLAAGRSLTLSGDSIAADAELYTHKIAAIGFDDPTADDDYAGFAYAFQNFTITGIYCKTDTGTVDLDIQLDDGTPADVNGTDITCTSSGVVDTSFAGDTGFASGEQMDLLITSVASSPTNLIVNVWGTVDD